ncbi:MAG TPA: trypsin-like peptidase domain-containing protein [Bdellovibrio sp.]|uniref:trypsin-like peptidase domain-containing protein n=1 Tax=Bdellovibrio sp. TaxID=28201 RepID=UPI002EDDEBE1
MTKKTITAALILFAALPSWSKSKTSSTASISEEATHYKVICENADDCHPAVAGLLADDSSVCTSVLVKDDVMATNLHCLPEDLRKEGALCKGRISFTFPESKGHPEEIAECDHVLSVSSALKDTPLTPDYAFLRLKHKTLRTPVVINNQGVANNEKLTIYKVDPHEDVGLLRKVTCSAAQKSMLNPLFLTPQSSVISLVPCDIVSGNSGSPIFSSANEVKALVNSKGLPADMPISVDRFDVAFASNFSCLNIPSLGLVNKNKGCLDSQDRASIRNASGILVKDSVHPLMTSLTKNVTEQFKLIHDQTRNILKWETDQKDIPYNGDDKSEIAKVGFKPKCISASRENMRKMQEEIMKVKYSEWGVQLALDSAGRPNPQLASTEVSGTLSFSKEDLKKTEVAIKLGSTYYSVPFCSEIAAK